MSEKEYIEREAAETAVANYFGFTSARASVAAEKILSTVPAADVVEVVRCRECKWFGLAGCAIQIVDDTDKPSENDFCSFGERKGGDE